MFVYKINQNIAIRVVCNLLDVSPCVRVAGPKILIFNDMKLIRNLATMEVFAISNIGTNHVKSCFTGTVMSKRLKAV